MADVETLLSDWLRAEWDRDPVSASRAGLTEWDDRLGECDAGAWTGQAGVDRHWAGRLDAAGSPDLPVDQRIDLALALTRLAGRSALDDWQAWRRDPGVYLGQCLEGVFVLFLNRLRPEAELVAAAVSRLRQVPAVLAAARANLDAELAPPLLVQRALRSCRAGATWLRDGLATEASGDLRADLADAGAAAATVLDDFTAFLDGLLGRARGDWAIGETRYSALLRQVELLGYGTTELHARGLVAWDGLDAELTELAGRVDPGAGSWRAAVTGLALDHPATPEAMRDAYEASCAAARDFLIERQLVTLPAGEVCRVVPAPPFSRPLLAVASYNEPPPFSASTTGYFFVPWPPDDVTADDLVERLADNNFHAIPTISVHEAYPGHHWQLTWSARTPRPVRKAVSTPYFIEGWALYAEAMMREQGYFTDPRAELCSLDARIFRAARMVVDTALHSGEMTAEQGVDYMMGHTSLPPAVARAEVERYCADATQAPSYLTGALEIERLRARWTAEGRGGLREFHDAVAASPGLPVALAEVAVFGTGPAGDAGAG